jgi:serine/threonine protein kinase
MDTTCPRCQQPIAVVVTKRFQESTCPSCGESFSLNVSDPAAPATTIDEPAADSVSNDPWAMAPPIHVGAPTHLPALPGYEILGELGRGGMGVVYKALHVRLNRPVALKMVLQGTFASEEQRVRFLIEAEMAARVKHANIVQVYEVGTHENRPYFALEFVSGGTLHQQLRSRRPTPRQAAKLMETLARAVQAAHAQGIIHRDLKPANVLLEPDGTPKITDFGLAKKLETPSPDREGGGGLTATGAIMGTPSYMAPEQAAGKSKDVGPYADIYALGAILYEGLTGRPPFTGSSPMEVVRKVLEEEPVPPRQQVKGLSRDLEVICLKCLQKEPEKRYGSAGELAEDLRRFLDDRPIRARSAGSIERAWRWCRRKPAVAALSAVVVTSLIAVTAISISYAVHSENARVEIEGQRTELAQRHHALQAAHAHGVILNERARQAIETVTSESAIEQLTREKELSPEQKDFLDKMIRYYAESTQEAAATAQERWRLARAYYNMGRMNQILGRSRNGEVAYRRALALYQQLGAELRAQPEFRQEQAATHNNLGILLESTGQLLEAESAYAEALVIQKELAANFPTRPEYRRVLAGSHNNLAVLLSDTGRLREGELAYGDALAIRKQLAADFPSRPEFRQELAVSHTNLGNLFQITGRLLDAEKAYAEALAINKRLAADFRVRPEFRQQLAASQNGLGNLFHATGRLSEAGAAYSDALRISKQLVTDFPTRPEFRQDLALSHSNLASLLTTTGQLDEAKTAYTEALAVRTQLAADFPNQPEFRQELATSHNNLGVLFRHTGRLQEAESAYANALTIQKQLVADFPRRPAFLQDLAGSHNNLGNLLSDGGRWKEAELAHSEALAVTKQLAADFPARPEFARDLAASHNNLGTIFSATGRLQEAELALAQAFALHRKLSIDFPHVPDHHNLAAGTLANLAIIVRQRRDFSAARQRLDEALPYHQAALQANPRHPEYRQFYRNNLAELTLSCAGQCDRAAALATATKRRGLGWSPAADAHDAACMLAQCVPIVEKHDKLDATKRQAEAQFYANEAMKMLHDAIAMGFKDVAHMKQDRDLDPLRQREDFQKLLAELEKN